MNVPTSQGPTLKELQDILPICRNWPREERVMIGLLCVLSIGIFGISSNSRLPLHCAKRVMDREAFQRYPWGRVGFISLLESIKVLTYEGKQSYTLHGCVHALYIWIFEHVPGLGEKFGNRIEGADVPLLSWRGSRPRINFSDFCAQEKRKYQKVRVRHMVVKPIEDRYPKWDDNEVSIELDNMIQDILKGQLDEKFWEVTAATKSNKRKIHVHPPVVPDTTDVGPSSKRKKDNEHGDGCQASEMVVAHNIAILGLVESVKIMTAKLDGIDVNVADKVSEKLEATIQAKVDARVCLYEKEFLEKIAMLQEEVKNLKEKLGVNIPPDVANSNDQNSIAQEEDDDSSSALSWMVEKKINSQDGLPIQCVVKKEKKENTAMKKERKTSDVKKKGKKDEVSLKKVKKEKAFSIPELNDKSISSEGWNQHLRWENSEECRQALEAIASTLEEPTRRRKPQLTKTQVWPYVGNSTVKRIITGVTPSKVSYDPFAKVESQKLVKVLDFIKRDLEKKHSQYGGYSELCAQFYLKLMVPRNVWPTENYGWLCDSHIAAAMLMFHRRSMQSTSPYASPRIAFLDQWFVKSWVSDFEKQDKKKIEVSDIYIKAFNGEYPEEFVTGKKWFEDVDSLFLCHLINGNHWVALHIDLKKATINVYDSIPSVVKDQKQLQEECRPFTKMIPLVLNKMLPPELGKKSEQQFALRRHKKIPHNDDPGDCGVYSLKYIECLAVGCTFVGLSDTIIPAQRMKLAAEIYEEVAEVVAEG
ncbi:Ulp1 protease family protein [Raphanus sativus]|nr:Ulp1 protease family protein [Raphanus sativus]